MRWAELVLDCIRVHKVKGSVEEQTERALTTDDPVEREQLVRQVVGGAITLGRLQERVRRDLANTIGEEEELVNHYLQSTLVKDVLSWLTYDQVHGRSAHQTLRRLGTPRELVTRGGLSDSMPRSYPD
jgi:hypothetical protein